MADAILTSVLFDPLVQAATAFHIYLRSHKNLYVSVLLNTYVEYSVRQRARGRGTEFTRFTPALLSPRFRQSVGTLVLRGKGGILSLYQDSAASDITATGDDDTAAVEEGASDTSDDQRTVLRKTGVGETVQDDVALTDSAESAVDRKYEDPRAEQAHRRARRRDPEDVVELGEEVTLVLQEADFSTHPATVRGSKQGLVVFVQNPLQDLTTHDTIRVKIVDFGGKRNSAQAEFIGYD